MAFNIRLFCSLKSTLELESLSFPVTSVVWNPEIIPGKNMNAFLNWLNKPFKSEDVAAIRKGFRRLSFSPPKTR